MKETKVVNIRKEKYDVYIGRGSVFGNPFTHLPLRNTKAEYQVKTREEAIERYKEWFYNKLDSDDDFLVKVSELKGKTLGCYCKPKSCHGDIIKEFLDNI
jgi:polynucleotide 5'-kinase involved in rRNA processing